MSFPYREVMAAEKLVAGSPAWTGPEGADKRMRLVAPLSLKGRVLRGLELVGRAHLDVINADSTFSIIYLPTDNRRDAVIMARLDWRPKAPHENDHPKCPVELQGLRIMGSHHHSFDLNFPASNSEPLKAMPIAEPIVKDYQRFKELVDAVGALFRISNAGSTLSSPWPQDMFNDDGFRSN